MDCTGSLARANLVRAGCLLIGLQYKACVVAALSLGKPCAGGCWSILIRRAARKQLAVGPRLIYHPGDRRPGKNPPAVLDNSRKSVAERVHPVGVEQRRRCRTLRQ